MKAHRRLYHSALASKMIEKNQFSPCPTPQSSAQFRESYFPLIKEVRRMREPPICTHTLTHTHTHIHTHTHTYKHTHTYTHTHMYTHTYRQRRWT